MAEDRRSVRTSPWAGIAIPLRAGAPRRDVLAKRSWITLKSKTLGRGPICAETMAF
jgi:hypothetical protein